MHREIAKLLLYSDLGEGSILSSLARIYRDWEDRNCEKTDLVQRIYRQVKGILDVATTYGFNTNLWHNYLTFVLLTNENSFSLTAERVGAGSGSVNHFAKADFNDIPHLDFCAGFYHLIADFHTASAAGLAGYRPPFDKTGNF